MAVVVQKANCIMKSIDVVQLHVLPVVIGNGPQELKKTWKQELMEASPAQLQPSQEDKLHSHHPLQGYPLESYYLGSKIGYRNPRKHDPYIRHPSGPCNKIFVYPAIILSLAAGLEGECDIMVEVVYHQLQSPEGVAIQLCVEIRTTTEIRLIRVPYKIWMGTRATFYKEIDGTNPVMQIS